MSLIGVCVSICSVQSALPCRPLDRRPSDDAAAEDPAVATSLAKPLVPTSALATKVVPDEEELEAVVVEVVATCEESAIGVEELAIEIDEVRGETSL